MTEKPAVALIGAGAMGGALLKGWVTGGIIDARRSVIFDPHAPSDVHGIAKEHGIALNPDMPSSEADFIVLAIKPQAADLVLPTYKSLLGRACSISVMAGLSIARINAIAGGDARIARAMPNLPVALGAGAIGVYAGEEISEGERAGISTLLSAVGEVAWVQSETQIDVVTAVSGSGPAYFFLLTEALSEAGEALGLAPEVAALLARTTAKGAGAMMGVDPRTPAEMRRAVTSPGGTTAAALGVLDGEGSAMRELLNGAVRAAAQRAQELTN